MVWMSIVVGRGRSDSDSQTYKQTDSSEDKVKEGRTESLLHPLGSWRITNIYIDMYIAGAGQEGRKKEEEVFQARP